MVGEIRDKALRKTDFAEIKRLNKVWNLEFQNYILSDMNLFLCESEAVLILAWFILDMDSTDHIWILAWQPHSETSAQYWWNPSLLILSDRN